MIATPTPGSGTVFILASPVDVYPLTPPCRSTESIQGRFPETRVKKLNPGTSAAPSGTNVLVPPTYSPPWSNSEALNCAPDMVCEYGPPAAKFTPANFHTPPSLMNAPAPES